MSIVLLLWFDTPDGEGMDGLSDLHRQGLPKSAMPSAYIGGKDAYVIAWACRPMTTASSRFSASSLLRMADT